MVPVIDVIAAASRPHDREVALRQENLVITKPCSDFGKANAPYRNG
jgi:hypothetical protein